MRSSGQRFFAVSPARTRFSSTLRLPKMRRSSCTSCMPACAMAWLFWPARSTPSNMIEPVRGVTTPIRLFRSCSCRRRCGRAAPPPRCARRASATSNRMWRIAVVAVQAVDFEQAHVFEHSAEIGFLHGGVALDLVRRAFDQHAALLQHGDALGQFEQRVHVVVDDDHGAALADRFEQLAPSRRARAGSCRRAARRAAAGSGEVASASPISSRRFSP